MIQCYYEPDDSMDGTSVQVKAFEVIGDQDAYITLALQLFYVQLSKPVADSQRQVPLAYVSGRVHAGEQAEVGVPHQGFCIHDFILT